MLKTGHTRPANTDKPPKLEVVNRLFALARFLPDNLRDLSPGISTTAVKFPEISRLIQTSGHTHTRTHTHTHSRLTAIFPGLPGTRKAKPIWILLKQETVSGSGISWAICKSAPSSRQITTPTPHHSVFYRPDALPAAQPTASKHWRQSGHCRLNWNSAQNTRRAFIQMKRPKNWQTYNFRPFRCKFIICWN